MDFAITLFLTAQKFVSYRVCSIQLIVLKSVLNFKRAALAHHFPKTTLVDGFGLFYYPWAFGIKFDELQLIRVFNVVEDHPGI